MMSKVTVARATFFTWHLPFGIGGRTFAKRFYHGGRHPLSPPPCHPQRSLACPCGA